MFALYQIFKTPHGKIDNIRDNPVGKRGGKTFLFKSRNIEIEVNY